MNLRPSHPLVVLDCSVIQAMPGQRMYLPPIWHALLTDTFFTEIADKPTGERQEYLKKVVTLVRIQPDRCWVGNSLHPLLTAESKSRLHELVHPELTRILRKSVYDEKFDLVAMFNRSDVWDSHGKMYTRRKIFFSEMTNGFRKLDDRIRGISRSESHEEIVRAVRDPELVADFAIEMVWGNRCPFPRSRIACFPDRLPAARWLRLIAYYCCIRCKQIEGCGKDPEFLNNLDDLESALVGSCTGHLATQDNGLREAAKVVAPGIRLWKWCSDSNNFARVVAPN